MAGIFHAYYTVALAPAIAALVGIGAWSCGRRRTRYAASAVLACTVALTTAFAFMLLHRTDYLPWLRWVVRGVGLAAALMVGRPAPARRVGLGVAAAALVAALAAPGGVLRHTAATPHTGSIPSAGPATPAAAPVRRRAAPGPHPAGRAPPGGAAFGSTGGLLEGSSLGRVTALLRTDADAYTWAAAAVGANSAAGYQLASEEPVMAIGGFNGSDPSPTLAQFQEYVANGEIHYFIASGEAGGAGGMDAGGSTSSEIASWVTASFTAEPSTASRSTTSRTVRVTAPTPRPAGRAAPEAAAIDVVIPVHNEEVDLAASVARVHRHLARLPYTFRITIADNASTDGTALVAHRLAHEYDEVRVFPRREGPGPRAQAGLVASRAEVLVYMDVDLSTDLNALLPLVAPLSPGTRTWRSARRLTRGSRTLRGAKRELISRGYNLLLRGAAHRLLRRAVRLQGDPPDVAQALLPLVEDTLVLRHRAAGARRAGRPAHPRGPRRLGRRPGQPGGHLAHRDRRPPRDRPAGLGPAAGRLPLAEVTARLGRGPRGADRPGLAGRAVRRDRRLLDRPLRRALPPPARGGRQPVRPTLLALAADRGRRTPPPTGASPSACAAAPALRHQFRVWRSSPSGWRDPGSLWLLHALVPAPSTDGGGGADPGEPVRDRDAVRRHAALDLRAGGSRLSPEHLRRAASAARRGLAPAGGLHDLLGGLPHLALEVAGVELRGRAPPRRPRATG